MPAQLLVVAPARSLPDDTPQESPNASSGRQQPPCRFGRNDAVWRSIQMTRWIGKSFLLPPTDERRRRNALRHSRTSNVLRDSAGTSPSRTGSPCVFATSSVGFGSRAAYCELGFKSIRMCRRYLRLIDPTPRVWFHTV